MARERRRNRDIQNILGVLGTAVLCAGLLAFLLIYYYGPSGRYLAGYTMLDPSIIEQINYQDKHPRTGQKVKFIFDRMEFSYFDPKRGQVKQTIPLEDYKKFYTLVASEKSLQNVSDDILNLFLKSRPTVLTVSMRASENSDQSTAKTFQVVQFVTEDYFRVQLLDRQEEWAYFYRSHLYQTVMQLFNQSPSL